MNIVQSRKRKTITEVITHKTDAGFNIKETIVNGKKKSIELTCRDKNIFPIMLKLPKDFIEKYDSYYDIFKHEIKPKTVEDVLGENIYFAYNSGHMLFDKNKNIVSLPYNLNYCGSLTENYRDDPIYAKLISQLKEHPFVMNLEEEEIPYYNRDFDGQMGIKKCRVLLPQAKMEELYNKYKDDEFWTCSIKDNVAMSYNTEDIRKLYGDSIDTLVVEYWKEKYNR